MLCPRVLLDLLWVLILIKNSLFYGHSSVHNMLSQTNFFSLLQESSLKILHYLSHCSIICSCDVFFGKEKSHQKDAGVQNSGQMPSLTGKLEEVLPAN